MKYAALLIDDFRIFDTREQWNIPMINNWRKNLGRLGAEVSVVVLGVTIAL